MKKSRDRVEAYIKKVFRMIDLKKSKNIVFLKLDTFTSQLSLKILNTLKNKLKFQIICKDVAYIDDIEDIPYECPILVPVAQEHLFPVIIGKILKIKKLDWMFKSNVWPIGLYITEEEAARVLSSKPNYFIFRDTMLRDLMNIFLDLAERNPKYKKTVHNLYLVLRDL